MSLILSLETATPVCSVALHKDGKLLGLKELHLSQSHSALLGILVQDIVRHTGHRLEDLDVVAVSKGPGSYTGLRIGTASAKGLCYALDKPLVAINTLEAMAYGVAQYITDEALLCPMIDARRMEVYALIVNAQLNTLMPTRPVVVEEGTFDEFSKDRPFLYFGDGAAKCEQVLSVAPNSRFIDNVTPSAKYVGALAHEMQKQNKLVHEDLAYFEPYYLKEFVAKQPKTKV